MILFKQLDALFSHKIPFNLEKLVLPVIVILFYLPPLNCFAVPLVPIFFNYYPTFRRVLPLWYLAYWRKLHPLISIFCYLLCLFFFKASWAPYHSSRRPKTSAQLYSLSIEWVECDKNLLAEECSLILASSHFQNIRRIRKNITVRFRGLRLRYTHIGYKFSFITKVVHSDDTRSWLVCAWYD